MNKDRFNFFLETSAIEKSQYPKGDDRRYENMILEGLASDDSEDQDGESMNPNGFEIDHFLKYGLVNLDHLTTRAPKDKSRFWVGEPLEGYIKDNKFYVKVKLWKKSPEARAFYDKAIEMEESRSSRKPGFSIEGSSIEKDKLNPKKIKKARITNLAVTFNPVNANSYADIVKGKQREDFIPTIGNGVMLEIDINQEKIMIDTAGNIISSKKEESVLKSLGGFKEKGIISEKVLDDFKKGCKKI